MAPPSPSSFPGTIILTGCNSGLGLATVQAILASPQSSTHHSIFTVRNPSSPACANLRKVLEKHKDKSTELAALDFSTLAAVRSFTDGINKRVSSGELPPIRALLLNAAMQEVTGQNFTTDGFERTFAVNYLAQFLLVLRLLGSMEKGNNGKEPGRVVIVSSWTHDPRHPWNSNMKMPEKVFRDPETIARPPKADDPKELYNEGMLRYGLSKTLIMTFMFALQKRLDRSPTLNKISILAMDPQAMPDTNLIHNSPLYIQLLVNVFMRLLLPIMSALNQPFQSAHTSAKGLLYAAFDKKELGELPKTKYVGFKLKLEEPNPECKDEQNQEVLWRKSVEFAGLKPGETVLEDWQ